MTLTRREAVVAAALTVAVGLLGVLRWAGPYPFGSDHDEYRMLATNLWHGAGPVVAGGVEGTKYPLGYALIIGAPAALGLPLTATALVLNGVLLLGTAALVLGVARRFGLPAAVLGTATLALSPPLWDSFYSVMPELALVAVVAGAFAWLLREPGRHDVVVLCLLAGAATALKTLGVTLALALGAALLTRGRRRWAWAPPLAALAVIGAQAVWLARFPAATTGYSATFWLRDPGDAAAGTVGFACRSRCGGVVVCFVRHGTS